jgi:hypothetical protein
LEIKIFGKFLPLPIHLPLNQLQPQKLWLMMDQLLSRISEKLLAKEDPLPLEVWHKFSSKLTTIRAKLWTPLN